MKIMHLFGLSFAVLMIGLALPATAEMKFTIKDPYGMETSSSAKAGALYLSIYNHGDKADKLIGVEIPSEYADRAELHTHMHENGVMKMRQVEGIDLPAGEETVLKPGGDHIMLMGLKKKLEAGTTIPLTLTFEKSAKTPVKAEIRSLKDKAPKTDHQGAGHDHHHHHGH